MIKEVQTTSNVMRKKDAYFIAFRQVEDTTYFQKYKSSWMPLRLRLKSLHLGHSPRYGE
jgi:hypothetical protein